MKKSLLTLTLLVGFAPAVIANGDDNAKAKPSTEKTATVENTEAKTTEDVVPAWKRGYNWTKNHVSSNKRAYTIGGVSTLAFGGLGFAGYKNPRTVRSVVKSTKRFGRRGLSFVKAHKLATLGSTAAVITVGLGIWKREAVKNACQTGWNKVSAKWASRPSWMFNKTETASEDNQDADATSTDATDNEATAK